MLCNRKILLVLDDVSERSQLENLAGKQGWFGEGSIILVTTRDKHVLSSYDVSTQYDMKLLNDDESFEIFHQNAFKGKKPNKDYLELSRTVIHYAKGLPLVFKVLGSFLCGRSILEWKDATTKFRKVLPNDVLKILQMSFDGLDDDEKNNFLDIACFFNGKRKDYVIQTLQILDLHPIVGIKVLIDKSLVTDDEGILWVHDILQELGKNIVFQESPNDVGKHSRIWSLEDANYVLERNMGTEAIRGIVLRLDHECVSYWDSQAFLRMSNFKLLIITSSSPNTHSSLKLPYGLECFSSALKVLQWKGSYLDALPSHVPCELIDHKTKPSPLKQLWRGSQVFGRLKFIDLSYSRYLIKTPNFDEIPDLQNLILKGCINLVEVHPSLGHHQNLVTVNLKGCKSIKTLPSKFEMKCLENLIPSGCFKIRQLPEFGQSMKCLTKLKARYWTFQLRQDYMIPFIMNIGGSEVPSWFHNQNCFCDDSWQFQPNVSFITDIKGHHHSSKQLGIAVCLVIEGHGASASYDEDYWNSSVGWICRNFGDEILYPLACQRINERHNDRSQLFLFIFTYVDKNRLQISFHVGNRGTEANFEIKKGGWRELCKEDIEAWRRTRGQGCSSNNKCSDNYHNHNELGAIEATSDSVSNSQSINGTEEEDGQSNVDVDFQMPLTKRRKL